MRVNRHPRPNERGECGPGIQRKNRRRRIIFCVFDSFALDPRPAPRVPRARSRMTLFLAHSDSPSSSRPECALKRHPRPNERSECEPGIQRKNRRRRKTFLCLRQFCAGSPTSAARAARSVEDDVVLGTCDSPSSGRPPAPELETKKPARWRAFPFLRSSA